MSSPGSTPAAARPVGRAFVPALVYAALTSAVVSSLGMLLVPSVAEEFGVPVATAQWMLTLNLLVGAVATPVMGRLADGRNPRALLLSSLGIIALGSLLATVATSFWLFLLGRALQGLLYGTVPVTITLARRHLTEERSRPAISTLSVTVASGMGLGYPLTGVLAELVDYRAAFAFAVGFVASAALVVWLLVPAPDPTTRPARRPFDTPGALLLGTGLAALVLVLSEGGRWGWASATTLGVGLLSVAAIGGWVVVALRSAHPLVDLRVLRSGEVILANLTAIGLGAALYIGLSVASLVAQAPAGTGVGLGVPVLWAGFLMAPLSVGSLAANRVVRVLTRRIDMAVFLPVGAAVMTASSVLLWLEHDRILWLGIGMFLFGVGIGTGYAAMPALISRRVAANQLGSAVSVNQVLRTVGGALGAAATAAVLAAHPSPGAGPYPTDAGITGAFGVGVLCCTAVMTALTLHRVRSRRISPR